MNEGPRDEDATSAMGAVAGVRASEFLLSVIARLEAPA